MFIINLIPLHVFVLLLMGRFSHRIFVGKSPCFVKTNIGSRVFSVVAPTLWNSRRFRVKLEGSIMNFDRQLMTLLSPHSCLRCPTDC